MTLHVACAARGAYLAHGAVMVRSVVAHHRGGDLRVHVLHGGRLARRDRRRLERAGEGAVELHAVDDGRVADLPVRDYFTPAMWYRLLLPELLGGIGRVLYLDVDTLALDDLSPLATFELRGAAVGAVTNVFQPDHLFHPADLGIPSGRYFNSGVLLLDLDVLRRDDAVATVREVARSRAGLRGWPDQDALNVVLGARREPLHPRFNAMNALFELPGAAAVFGEEAVAEARRAPAIRHFEGPAANKPWARGSRAPHRDEWRALRRELRLRR